MSELTGRYVGQPFEKISCMGLLHSMYTDIGVDVPDTFKGLTLETYFSAWEKDKKGTVGIMQDLFDTLGSPVKDLARLQRYDLLVVRETRDGKKNIYPAMYLGLGLAITSNLHKGVRVFHIGELHQVIKARRFGICPS
ncbi:MAG: hypothetical protein MI862_02085 [Desulfobacterales bacterium]|nr:hypothetical protein [Desulfobacterales bacterium]